MTKKLLLQKLPIPLASLLYFLLSFLSSEIILIYIILILTAINILMMFLMRNEEPKAKAVFAVMLHVLFFLFIFGFFEMQAYSLLIFLSVNFSVFRTGFMNEARRYYFSSIAVMSLVLVLSEGAMRLTSNIEAAALYSNPDYPALNIFKESTALTQKRIHGDLIHDGADSSECEYREQSFETDKYGYLNKDETYKSPVDIIVLGDSYSAVSSMKQSDIWVELLRRETKLNVCNLAVSGNEPWQEFVSFFVMKDKMKLSESGLIVWQIFEGNDFNTFYGEIRQDCDYRKDKITMLNEEIENFRKTNNFSASVHGLFRKNEAKREDLIEIKTNSKTMHCMKSYSAIVKTPLNELEKKSEAEHLRMIMRIMSDEAKKMNYELAVLFIPSKCSVCKVILEDDSSKYTRSGFSLLTEKICRENGIDFIEAGYSLFSESKELYSKSGEFLWWLDDSHLNTKGNKVVEETVETYIENLLM